MEHTNLLRAEKMVLVVCGRHSTFTVEVTELAAEKYRRDGVVCRLANESERAAYYARRDASAKAG